jgi:hypothetical protein
MPATGGAWIGSLTVTAPANGFFLVVGTGGFSSTATGNNLILVGVSNGQTQPNNFAFVTDPPSVGGVPSWASYAQQAVFPVTSGTTYTFYTYVAVQQGSFAGGNSLGSMTAFFTAAQLP